MPRFIAELSAVHPFSCKQKRAPDCAGMISTSPFGLARIGTRYKIVPSGFSTTSVLSDSKSAIVVPLMNEAGGRKEQQGNGRCRSDWPGSLRYHCPRF